MPKTVIIRHTWYCDQCNLQSDGPFTKCFTSGCNGMGVAEEDPDRCGALTVIGLEDIELEIEERGLRDEDAAYWRRLRTLDMQIAIENAKRRQHNPKEARDWNARHNARH